VKLGPRTASRPWTRADNVQLLALFASGMETALVARKLKRTVQAVRTRKRRLNKRLADPGLSFTPTERLTAARSFASANEAET
jgi:hypothetical protein